MDDCNSLENAVVKRVCRECKKEKPLTDFPKKSKEVFRSHCKDCHSKRRNVSKTSPKLEDLSVKINMEGPTCDWSTVLLGIIKADQNLGLQGSDPLELGFFNANISTIEQFLAKESNQ